MKMINSFEIISFSIFLVGIILIVFLLFLLFSSFLGAVIADVGENVTVISEMGIGKSPPIINYIDVEQGSVTLIANSTKVVNCSAEIIDYDTEIDIVNVSAEFFHSSSGYGSPNDNNDHYTNYTCYVDLSYGDVNTVLATCLFDIWFYANAGTWNCTVNVTDDFGFGVKDSNTTTIQSLLAISLPDIINYGTVNATYVSDEDPVNITNVGNVMLNLSLSGYAVTEGDGLAMNCSLGNSNISVNHEKYNSTTSNTSVMGLTDFDSTYVNLTGSPDVKEFNLNYRSNDTINYATNTTYWRIYVPLGVGGNCSGNIIFGASQAEGD